MRWMWLGLVTASVCFAGGECKTQRFETRLVRDACEDGGQKAAREAMKKFQRRAREMRADLDCKSCHKTLTPDYTLNKDALEQFKELGGE